MSGFIVFLAAIVFFIAVHKAAQALNRYTESKLVSIFTVLGALFLTWPLILILVSLDETDPQSIEARQILGVCAAFTGALLFLRNLKMVQSLTLATAGLLLQSVLAIVALPGVILIGVGVNFLVS